MHTTLNDRLRQLIVGLMFLGSVGCQPTSSEPNAAPAGQPTRETPSVGGATEATESAQSELPDQSDLRNAADYRQQREALDRSLWSAEVDAQRHEAVIVRVWDALRGLDDEFETLKQVEFETLVFAEPELTANLDLAIERFDCLGAERRLTHQEWQTLLEQLRVDGYRIVQTEWHHSRFEPQQAERPASSVVSFAIDLDRESPVSRVSVRGNLAIQWVAAQAATEAPRIATIELRDGLILQRQAPAMFREILRVRTDSRFKRLLPLLLADLDGNGGSEILLGGLNRLYWNDGQGTLTLEPLTTPACEMFDAAVLADFNGDLATDLLCVSNDRYPVLLAGDRRGRFSTPPVRCADVTFELPKAFTAGDIDGDHDLDVWIGQYKFPYQQGAMPTPFYDANDGYPAMLLQNDGTGKFTEVTAAAGLDEKRNRRTYSASFVDLDLDNDLDLMTINDFAGVDVYENRGQGHFHDVTTSWLSDRHLFGMGHTLADYDRDGRLDMYLIGMSSTTARRLDQLKLGRDDRPDINQKRSVMGYGNRMLLARPTDQSPFFSQSPTNEQVARTGWSWGTTSTDFDNDGDTDIYVANGHTSGQSAKDYCTRYWCHDVYTGSSTENRELSLLFDESLSDFRRGEISWNGFEHNVLWLNDDRLGFVNVAFLLGVGFEFDSRAVASDDLDNDGRRDLLVVRFHQERSGKVEYELLVLRNELSTDRHWIGARLGEAFTGRSPLGARVTLLTEDGRTQVQVVTSGDSFSTQHAATIHFGLGPAQSIKGLQVQWPDGTEIMLDSPAINQYHSISLPQADGQVQPSAE